MFKKKNLKEKIELLELKVNHFIERFDKNEQLNNILTLALQYPTWIIYIKHPYFTRYFRYSRNLTEKFVMENLFERNFNDLNAQGFTFRESTKNYDLWVKE